MGITVIEKNCKGCDLCIQYCPQKVYEKSTAPNEKGYYIPIVAHPEKCTDLVTGKLLKRGVCRFCIKICPSQAIEITEDK